MGEEELKQHEATGHKGTKVDKIKSEKDYLMLAKVYDRLSQDSTYVTLFSNF